MSVRNSLLVARTDADELTCPDAMVVDSALEMEVAGNTALGPIPGDTSEWSVGYGQGNFGLVDPAPEGLETTATWRAGDPATDIDGDPRPTEDGSPDFAGADRIP